MLAGKRIKTLVAVLSAVFLITTCCGIAFADDIGPVYDAGDHLDGGGGHGIEVPRIVQGPTMLSADGYEVCVYAFDRYTAAFIACGYDYEDYQLLSDDAKALLSNADTGGAFYTFAQSMSQPTPYLVTNLLYGFDSVWYGRYTYELQRDARQAIQDAIDGNVSGGGGNTGAQGYYNFTGGIKYASSASDSQYILGSDGVKYYTDKYSGKLGRAIVDTPLNVRVNNNVNVLQRVLSDYPTGDLFVNITPTKDGAVSLGLIGGTINVLTNNNNGIVSKDMGDNYTYLDNTEYIGTYNVTGATYTSIVPAEYITYDPTSNTLTIDGNNATVSRYGPYNNRTFTNNYRMMGGIGSSAPTIPPTNWPDEQQPTTPTQPSVPDTPTNEPTTQPSEPSSPTVEPYPDIVYQPDTTYTQPDLSAVLDAMNEHCRHLQTAIHNGFSSFWSKLDALLTNLSTTFNRFLAQQLKWVVDSFNDSLQNLMTYLKSLFEWLAEQFDFTFTGDGYDDNTVVSWLIKIYSRLGAGINLRPADPVADPDGIGDWLTKLFTNLINLLMGLGSGIIDAIGEPLQQLTHKFPFSVPWDIAALLGMLVADPEVPVITMPSYALGTGGLSHVADYVIDLTPYDAYVGGIRLMIKLAFVIYLIANTNKYLDMLDKVVNTDA